MPAKDRYHDAVKRALLKDGWTVVREQVHLTYEDRYFWIDILAQNTLDAQIILVEVKELDDVASPIEALANALGKYLLYRMGLRYSEQHIALYLAVTEAAYNRLLRAKIGKDVVNQFQVSLLVFNPEQEEIVKWIP